MSEVVPGLKPFFGRPRLSGHYWHRQKLQKEEWDMVFYDAELGLYFEIGSEQGVELKLTKGHEWVGPIAPPAAQSAEFCPTKNVLLTDTAREH